MKRKLLITLLIVSSLALFANGSGEAQNKTGNNCFAKEDFFANETLTTLTGSVIFKNRIHPELNAGNQKYLLMVGPAKHYYPEDLTEGQPITVEGYVLTEDLIKKMTDAREDFQGCRGRGKMMGPLSTADGDTSLIIVKAVTINGERFEIDHGNYGRGMMGGPKYRGKMGYGPMM